MKRKQKDVFAMIRYWCRVGAFNLPKGKIKKTLGKVRKRNEVMRNCKLPF